MKLILAIFLLFSIVFSDIAVHVLPVSDYDIVLLDKKNETESESEKENEAESEKEKDIAEEDYKTLVFSVDFDFMEHSIYLSAIDDYFLEIHLPPPDFI